MVSNTTPTTPRTLLEAVNALLRAVRLSTIMSLSAAETNQDAASAREAVDSVAREVQLRGYEFNTDYEYTIDPSPSGEIILPNNTLKVRNVRCERVNRLVKRGARLYDNRNHTFNIGDSVELDLVVALPFEDMPESFKLYVTAVAARRWCTPRLPTGATFSYTQELVDNALAAAEAEDAETADTTLKDTSPHFAYMRGRRI